MMAACSFDSLGSVADVNEYCALIKSLASPSDDLVSASVFLTECPIANGVPT